MSHILSKRRRCGILLPITALPDGAENGDFDSAPRFIDWLAKAGVTVWQILPLGPTHDDLSPYLCLSAHAGNPALIGLRWLAKQQFFEASASTGDRRQTLGQAYLLFRHRADAQLVAEYEAFVSDATHWLEDYATFFVLWQHHKQLSWTEWPQALRDRTPSARKAQIDPARLGLFNQLQRLRHSAPPNRGSISGYCQAALGTGGGGAGWTTALQ